jgi:hypothetical protein
LARRDAGSAWQRKWKDRAWFDRELQLQQVLQICNEPLNQQFVKQQAALKKQGISAAVVSSWHGTLPANIESIARDNLKFTKKGKTDGGWFGAGLYFSDHADYTLLYTQSPLKPVQLGQTVRILLFDLLPGKVYKCLPDQSDLGKPLAPGYHSNHSPTGFERVLFDERHCLPRFVVEVTVGQSKGLAQFDASPEKNGPGTGKKEGAKQ